ncbi:hypothetical protein DL764_003054 [Monosporascus ibericus]|uniref:Auxin efflux carrier n=1 Tax=Monosporascus ibericus TaxID=155417 RepID=A0A4Q4TJT3_9PEZI|nr:hypothetical protein DL764_003054 [Monosporascus ibericus]
MIMAAATTSDTVTSLLGALQASASVLLTIGYGVTLSQFGLLEPGAAGQISRASVIFFLPALLVYNLGSNLHADTILRYIPICVWALVYNAISITIGRVFSHIFRFPRWTVPAITFNNTASMPLLLVQSLNAADVLPSLLMSSDDTTSDALSRAQSYLLVSAVVGNALTFGIGPAELKGYEEDPPRGGKETGNGRSDRTGEHACPRRVRWRPYSDVESQQHTDSNSVDDSGDTADANRGDANNADRGEAHNETNGGNGHVSILPNAAVERVGRLRQHIHKNAQQSFEGLPSPLRRTIRLILSFMNPPLGGALIGIIIGTVPPLHRVFFNKSDHGGYLNAWLTQSVKNIGELFVTLQVVIVGVKLSLSLRKEKLGEDTGRLTWGPVVFVTLVRYILWPAISVIWALATYTTLLSRDPVLWFSMMLMPVGPTAFKLMALADVSRADSKEKLVIAKFLALLRRHGHKGDEARRCIPPLPFLALECNNLETMFTSDPITFKGSPKGPNL